MSQTRRLAAILATDVAGYSRLMGADEEGTHERLQAHLAELVGPKISEHRGRIVKNTDDGFLAEFPSVVDAVRCAVEVQREMIDREREIAEERRIRFRIGINLGDVIVEEHDIFGDGVNVAARLEGLAEPGGICVSRVVRDQVRDRLDYAFEDLGEQQVKNIARPVRVYALQPNGAAALPKPSVASIPVISQPPVAPRLSIVVLPFANLSNDPDQQYFADGITEDLTTDLSRIPDMFVISRNTAFTYRNKPVDTKQIGRELRVRYVLEGSVRRSGNRVRVNAQLINADADGHVWAERFDGSTDDLFALQDEITSRLAVALDIELISAEVARPAGHPDALDCVLRGRAMTAKPRTRENRVEMIRLFDRALALDPGFVEAQSWLAIALTIGAMGGVTGSAGVDITRAEGLADRALAISPRSFIAHYAKAQVLRAHGRNKEAISEYEATIALNRNWVGAISSLGWCKFWTGSIEEAIPALEQAIRISPRDGQIENWYWRIGVVHLVQFRPGEAIVWFEKAISANPGHPVHRAFIASAYALTGDIDGACTELAEARRLSSDDRYSSLARLKAVTGYWGVPKVRALFEATYFAGLRKAGMPEE
jgi:TolB-like protein/class 3 adenylate cyclase/Flp pilus assembly protein TadD